MNDVFVNGVQYFVIIAEQKKKKKFLALLIEYEARGVEVVYAHGSMSPSAIAAAFGFEVEQSKVLIACLLKNERAKALMEVLYKEYRFNEPNTGCAFSVPVEGMAF